MNFIEMEMSSFWQNFVYWLVATPKVARMTTYMVQPVIQITNQKDNISIPMLKYV